MKKTLLLLLLVHLLAACTNDIEVLPNNEPQKLIINALMNASRTDNAIFLALSGYRHPEVVKNGVIHLYINGELSETVTECTHHSLDKYEWEYMDYFYRINSRFKAGDHVRIEVQTKDGKYKADAETTVYDPIEIDKVDTIINNNSSTEFMESLYNGQYTKWKIQLKTPDNGQTQYYRVNIKHNFTYHLLNRETRQDSIVACTQWGCSGYYDTALMDGRPGTPNHNDPILDFIPSIDNTYNVFSDIFFTDNQYTMTLDSYFSFSLNGELYEIKKITGNAIIQYYAISSNEYQYLRAASSYTNNDSSDLLAIPVIFPNNIKGGIGIFAIENPTESTIHLIE